MQFPHATPSAVKTCQAYQCWADQSGEPIPKVRLLISYLTMLMWLISSRMRTEKRQRRIASWGIQDLTCETVNHPDKATQFVSTWDAMWRLPYSFWNKTLKFTSLGEFVILVCLSFGLFGFCPLWKNLKSYSMKLLRAPVVWDILLVWDMTMKQDSNREQV